MVFLDGISDTSDVIRVANRIHKELASPFILNGYGASTTVSIGIALSSTGYDRSEDFLCDANTAMHHAKMLGPGRHEIFDESMHARAVALLQLESDLRRAIEQRELQVYYQPIVSLETGRITGFEALLRWWHPQYGLVLPGGVHFSSRRNGTNHPYRPVGARRGMPPDSRLAGAIPSKPTLVSQCKSFGQAVHTTQSH